MHSYYLIILSTLLFFLPITDRDKDKLFTIPEQKIDEIFKDYSLDTPGCGVGITQNGELTFSKGYGMANLDFGIPIESNSRFMIASVSKQFAAASLLMLNQQDKLHLDDDLRPSIDYISHFDQPITARQLIIHTSGIRDIYNLLSIADIGLDNTTTPKQALHMLQNQRGLNFNPGESHMYSNLAYFLMSHVVEEFSGMTLKEYSNKHFFEPIGMAHTHWHDDTEIIVPNRVTSYRPFNNGFGKFYRGNMDRVGARGLFTTIEDFAKWDRNFIENTSNLENFNEKMTEPGYTTSRDSINYAAGLRLGNYKGFRTVGHGGNYMGFRSNYTRFPEFNTSIIIFCNLSSISPASLTREIADLLLHDEIEKSFSAYTGTYRNQNFGNEITITFENGNLFMQRPFEKPEELTWTDEHTFRNGNWNIEFQIQNDGDALLKVASARTSAITFHKVSSN